MPHVMQVKCVHSPASYIGKLADRDSIISSGLFNTELTVFVQQ